VRFKVVTVVKLSMVVSCVVTPYDLAGGLHPEDGGDTFLRNAGDHLQKEITLSLNPKTFNVTLTAYLIKINRNEMCRQADKPSHCVFVLHTSCKERVTSIRENSNVVVLIMKLLPLLPSMGNLK
jgi:hypothetical protein